MMPNSVINRLRTIRFPHFLASARRLERVSPEDGQRICANGIERAEMAVHSSHIFYHTRALHAIIAFLQRATRQCTMPEPEIEFSPFSARMENSSRGLREFLANVRRQVAQETELEVESFHNPIFNPRRLRRRSRIVHEYSPEEPERERPPPPRPPPPPPPLPPPPRSITPPRLFSQSRSISRYPVLQTGQQQQIVVPTRPAPIRRSLRLEPPESSSSSFPERGTFGTTISTIGSSSFHSLFQRLSDSISDSVNEEPSRYRNNNLNNDENNNIFSFDEFESSDTSL